MVTLVSDGYLSCDARLRSCAFAFRIPRFRYTDASKTAGATGDGDGKESLSSRSGLFHSLKDVFRVG
jgi:hypothetical protein